MQLPVRFVVSSPEEWCLQFKHCITNTVLDYSQAANLNCKFMAVFKVFFFFKCNPYNQCFYILILCYLADMINLFRDKLRAQYRRVPGGAVYERSNLH